MQIAYHHACKKSIGFSWDPVPDDWHWLRDGAIIKGMAVAEGVRLIIQTGRRYPRERIKRREARQQRGAHTPALNKQS